MGVVVIVLEVLLGLAFVVSGGQKLAGAKGMRKEFERFGYSARFMYLTGLLEVAGAVGMFAGLFAPVWGALAGLLLATVMGGAVYSHVRAGDPVGEAVPASMLLVLAATVGAIHVLV